MEEEHKNSKTTWYTMLADYYTVPNNKIAMSITAGCFFTYYKFRSIKFERQVNSHFNSPSEILNKNIWSHHIKDVFLRSIALGVITYFSLDIFTRMCASSQTLEKLKENEQKLVQSSELIDESEESIREFKQKYSNSGNLRSTDSGQGLIKKSNSHIETIKSRNKIEAYITDKKID